MNINALGTALRRRDEILRLVAAGGVRSQDELAALLSHRGFLVTQPTLSRDLKDLGLVKGASGYVVPDAAPSRPGRAPERLSRVLREFSVSISPAASLVVVRTSAAGADPVARALDEWDDPAVRGTIAGEDTVFVATPGPAEAATLADRINGLLAPAGARLRAAGERQSSQPLKSTQSRRSQRSPRSPRPRPESR